MKFNKLLSCICFFALMLLASCSFAADPGVLYLPGSVPYDHDATNFIGRAGINPRGSEAKAIGRLIADLKQANLWTNFDAIYPFVGSTSNSCAQNLVSTNWGIAWSGSPTFDVKGVHGNGTDAWGDTSYKQSTRGALTNNFHLNTWAAPITDDAFTTGPMIANQNGGSSFGGIGTTYVGGLGARLMGYPLGNNLTPVNLGTNGNALASCIGTSSLIISDGFLGTITDNMAGAPTNSIHILGNINTGGAGASIDNWGLAIVRAASFGRGLTAQQATNYFIIMNRFHSTLNRPKP